MIAEFSVVRIFGKKFTYLVTDGVRNDVATPTFIQLVENKQTTNKQNK